MDRVAVIITIFGVAMAQHYFEERLKHDAEKDVKLKEIPPYFEVKGPNSLATFKKYVADIQELADKTDTHVTYKVTVNKVTKKKPKKEKSKKSKKFNVPLKKKNMKLSSFEMELRKHIGDKYIRKMSEHKQQTTEKNKIVIQVTKQGGTGKYKPILSGVKTKYTKLVKPVKNKIIALKS